MAEQYQDLIKAGLERGYSKDEVRETLTKQGYDITKVNKAFQQRSTPVETVDSYSSVVSGGRERGYSDTEIETKMKESGMGHDYINQAFIRVNENAMDVSNLVDAPKGARAGTIKGFNDPAMQAAAGLVKAHDVVEGAITSVPSIMEVIDDPLRLVDATKPFLNLGIAATEWIAQKGVDAVSTIAEGVLDTDINPDVTLPRIEGELGSYPERATKLAKANQKSSRQRKAWIKAYEAEFKKKNKSAPYITEVVSFIPDMMTAFMGSLANIPRYAAMIEAIMGGSRAETEGTDVGEGKIYGAIGGYASTKILNTFMNVLSPREAAQVAQIIKSPEEKADVIALLKYYQEHPDVSSEMVTAGRTGNPVIDGIAERQKQNLSNEAYNEYMKAMDTLGKKGRQVLDEVAKDFASSSSELSKKMRDNADNAWDNLAANITQTDTISGTQLAHDLDLVLVNASDTIKQFSKKLLDLKGNQLAIDDIVRQKKSLHVDYLASKEVASEEELKSLTKKYSTKIRELNESKAIYEGMDAEASQNLTADNVIEMIKKLNNKEFISGGNINVRDGKQRHYLNKMRKHLEDSLNDIPEIEKVKGAYDHAKAASRDMYETFGYSSGKNAGKKVYTPELGEVLGEAFPIQLKVVEGLLNEIPAVFASKIKHIEIRLGTQATNKLKKAYIESKIKKSVVKLDNSRAMPRVSAEAFEKDIRPLLDTADGRKMITDIYGENTLKDLSVVRLLTRELGEAAQDETNTLVQRSTFRAWTRDLPETISTITTQRMKDYLYTRRMLRAYGEKVNFSWSEAVLETGIGRVGGAAAGATIAPEGHEAEGAAVGAWAGKVGHRGKMIKDAGLIEKGAKIIKKVLK